MTTLLIDDIKNRQQFVPKVDEYDNSSLSEPDDEFISLNEFKAYMEKLAFERLGLEITL